jgi:phosphoserine phosphatase RsbU/P
LNPVRDAALRKQLFARRQRLQVSLPSVDTAPKLLDLLQEVDAALERMNAGTFGICDTCHDSIESDRLLLDPLCRNCLDHLSPYERRTLELDLDLAFQVQKGLLPDAAVQIEGWNSAYYYEPAGNVSGDYCDVIALEQGAALFLVGDVTGKGVAASMLMAHLHAIFRSLAGGTPSVTELVAKANRIFCQHNPSSHFVTLVCGHVNRQGSVAICNAGHCLPLRVSRGDVTRIDSTGLPLGLFGDAAYESERALLATGDTLVFYTDGLSESFNSSGGQYGIERLVGLLKERWALSPKELLAAVLDDAKQFRSGAPRTDDLTVMILRRDGRSTID